MKANEVIKKVLFADLDGTLIDTISGGTFPKGIWDMTFKLGVLDAIKVLKPECIMIVSNQGGIEQGFVDEAKFKYKLDYIVEAIEEYTGIPTGQMYCTSNDRNNTFRKPNTGMLETIIDHCIVDDNNHKYEKHEMLMIGDASGKQGQFSDSDKKTAENYGIDYMDIDDFVQLYANKAPKSKFVYPDKLYARCKDNKMLDISYAPQMMKGAKSGIGNYDNYIKFEDGTWIDLDPSEQLKPAFNVNEGDKVKVIVIKED